jgi:hypothetical protein
MQNNLLTELSLQQLQHAVAIREQIDDLERELSRIIASGSWPAKIAVPRRKGKLGAAAKAKLSATMKASWAKRKKGLSGAAVKAKGPSPRAPLKERIVASLRAAGKPGVSVKDLASQLGRNYSNINVWFHTTGKGIKEIKKVEQGRFTWVA